jgi:prepilin-type N-terminal cleavage/methylation domain-containing protein
MNLRGFTLIEVLFVVMMIAVLSLIVVTSASFMIHKNERQTLVEEIRTAIQYARMQAISLGHPVSLIPLDTELNWSKGMMLTQNNSKTNKTDTLYQWQWHHPHWSITWSGVNSPNKITLSNNPINAISNGTFVLFDTYTKERVAIILNRLGRIKVVSK